MDHKVLQHQLPEQTVDYLNVSYPSVNIRKINCQNLIPLSSHGLSPLGSSDSKLISRQRIQLRHAIEVLNAKPLTLQSNQERHKQMFLLQTSETVTRLFKQPKQAWS